MRTLAVALLLTTAVHAGPLDPLPAERWSRASARRLLDRAGFGGSPAEIDALFARGHAGAVDWLLAGDDEGDWRPCRLAPLCKPTLAELVRMPPAARQHARDRYRIADHARLATLRSGWIGAMLAGRSPLRDRLALEWHSHCAVEHAVVDRATWLARNATLLRRHAFDLGALLAALPRDPAVLEYLDNRSSRAEHPNENFARELLELYTVGEGHFSERDVREVARAFAGWTCDEAGVFAIVGPDRGAKRVLGADVADGQAVIAVLCRRPQTARRIAVRLVRLLIGRAPGVVAEISAQLLRDRLRLRPALRRLLLSRALFDAPPKVASGLVRCVRQARALGLGAEVAPLVAVLAADHVLYAPPSVAGWPPPREATSTASVLAAYEAGRVLALADRRAWAARQTTRMTSARERLERAAGLDRRGLPGREIQPRIDQVDATLARRFPGLAAAARVRAVARPTPPILRGLLAVPLPPASRTLLAPIADAHRRAQLLLSTPRALLH